MTTCWPSTDTVAIATPIPPSDARRSISNAPWSRMPLIVTAGAVVSRTVSVAERKFTPAAGTSQRGAVAQVRLSSTYSPVAGTSTVRAQAVSGVLALEFVVGRTGEISRSGGGPVEANAAERDTRRHVEAQADVLADRRIGPQERQVERTVRGPAPAVERRERGLDRVRHRVGERQPRPVRSMARPQPDLARAGSRRRSRRRRTVGVAVGVGVGVSVGVGVGVGVSVGVGVGVGVSVGVGVGVGVGVSVGVGSGVGVGVGVAVGSGVGVGVSVGVGVGVWRRRGGRLWRRRGGRRWSVGVGSGVGVGVATGLRTFNVWVCCVVLPAASVTSTRSVCGPSATVVVSTARPTWPMPGQSAPTARSTVPSAGESSAQPTKERAGDRRAVERTPSRARARRRCRSRGSRGRACRSPARAGRRPRAWAGSRPAPPGRRAQLEARAAGVRATLRRLAAEPQRHPLAAGRERHHAVAVGALEHARGRHRAVARPAPDAIQPHAGEGRHRRDVDPRHGLGARRRVRPREARPRASQLGHGVPAHGDGNRRRAPPRPARGRPTTRPRRRVRAPPRTARPARRSTRPTRALKFERSRKGTDSATHPVG